MRFSISSISNHAGDGGRFALGPHAYGVGQAQWQFASPDFPQGINDYSTIVGDGEGSAFVGGPAVGGDPDTTEGAGAVHISTGASAPGAAGRAQHWSNLLDWRQGTMFWLALATILYFGLVSLQVGARAGHFRIGAGSR